MYVGWSVGDFGENMILQEFKSTSWHLTVIMLTLFVEDTTVTVVTVFKKVYQESWDSKNYITVKFKI